MNRNINNMHVSPLRKTNVYGVSGQNIHEFVSTEYLGRIFMSLFLVLHILMA